MGISDKLAIHFFELKKINKKPNANNRKELWMQLINAESEEELEMIESVNVAGVNEGVTIIRRMRELGLL